MNVLAIDTCLGAVSVAVGRGDGSGFEIAAEAYEERQAGHAERLVAMVQGEMARAGLGFGDLRRVAVTLGPGTFTGVRTGIAAARAFRLAADVEVVGLTSLAVLAHPIIEAARGRGDGRPVLIAIDARRGRIYAQMFGQNALDPLSPPQELTAAMAAGSAEGRSILAAGSGARAVAEAVGRAASVEVVAERLEPRARDLALLAPRLGPLGDVRPIYIREPDAKPQDDKRLARMT